MCGSSDAPEVKQSPQEVSAARAAVAKYNERHEDGYVGLESAAIDDANLDHSQSLRGIGSAELANYEAAAYSSANPMRKGLDFGAIGSAVGTSLGSLDTESSRQGLSIKDAKTMGVIKTGQDMANNTAGALMSRARNGLDTAITDVEAELTRVMARNKAIADVASTGMAIYASKKANPQVNMQGQKKALYSNPAYMKRY